jgi:hypothetical protein
VEKIAAAVEASVPGRYVEVQIPLTVRRKRG